MKEFTNKEWDVMLCSTGYLPPRNDEELPSCLCHLQSSLLRKYEGYTPRIANRHVDVDAIINGKCKMVPSSVIDPESLVDVHNNETEDVVHYSMAARNYSHLPKSILDKMKEQHNATKDEG